MLRVSKLLTLIGAATLFSQIAVAQEAGIVTRPDWLKRPNATQMRQVWPVEALRTGLDGSATIGCHISAQGVLFDCKVVEETPAGSGFGSAAIALAPQFQMKPRTLDGKPVSGGLVRIPIRFESSGVRGSVTPGSPVATDIPWITAPTFDEVLAVYPKRARDAGVGGRANMFCTYTRAGRLTDCRSDAGLPSGYGFGSAAEKLAPLFTGPPLGENLARTNVKTQVSVVFAAETLSGSRLIGRPKWTGVPTADDLKAVYPPAAMAAGVTRARVVLNCRVAAGGQMHGCSVESEEPADMSIGAAALALSRTFKVSVWTGEGLPTVGGDVRAPLRFDLGPAAPAAN